MDDDDYSDEGSISSQEAMWRGLGGANDSANSEETDADDHGSGEGEDGDGETDAETHFKEVPFNLRDVSSRSNVVIVVRPEDRRTPNVMSKYEMTEATTIRAVQIATYNNCFVDTTGLTDPIAMAQHELMMRRSPLILVRPVQTTKNPVTGETEQWVEHWFPREMTFAQTSYNSS
jgi:DNA-directed RNA polymerase subunit K/omega